MRRTAHARRVDRYVETYEVFGSLYSAEWEERETEILREAFGVPEQSPARREFYEVPQSGLGPIVAARSVQGAGA